MDDSKEQALPLTHLTEEGRAQMVDVSEKTVTAREAVASAAVTMTPDVLERLLGGDLPKGEALATARIAGIQAAKRTGDWIPLCHPLSLDWVHIDFAKATPDRLEVVCTARTRARTGVEMEAMVGAAAAALTLYDMAKAADKAIVIGPVRLEQKTGGKSGDFRRDGG